MRTKVMQLHIHRTIFEVGAQVDTKREMLSVYFEIQSCFYIVSVLVIFQLD